MAQFNSFSPFVPSASGSSAPFSSFIPYGPFNPFDLKDPFRKLTLVARLHYFARDLKLI